MSTEIWKKINNCTLSPVLNKEKICSFTLQKVYVKKKKDSIKLVVNLSILECLIFFNGCQ